MTDKQKFDLRSHVTMHKPISRGGENGEMYFLTNGMTIEFTNCESYSRNSKFQINNNKYNYIWFSQLSNTFIMDDLTLVVGTIKNKRGETKQICEYDDDIDFWNEVKGKKYVVCAEGPFYTFNDNSKTADEKSLFSYPDIYDYVKQCVKNNRISDVGDCLKTANCYSLSEI